MSNLKIKTRCYDRRYVLFTCTKIYQRIKKILNKTTNKQGDKEILKYKKINKLICDDM